MMFFYVENGVLMVLADVDSGTKVERPATEDESVWYNDFMTQRDPPKADDEDKAGEA